ncbi:hypothetical protein [Haloferula sp. A504]|uniref:hypothetical protein n=1 Tax=Haloferula sp. A504 TaxID=3373601 RepID=UPI0031C60221|nr:hypothetical protein [Verrucomicrobiaceae bacterium E54]
MDPVEPWIDGDAVRRLARQLMTPPRRERKESTDDAGFGPGFEGFISSAPAADPFPAENEPAKPFLATPAAPDAPPPPEVPKVDLPPREPLLARLGRFREWLIQQLDAKGAFVLERDGEPVLDDADFTKLHFLARSLAQAYRPVKGEVGNVHVKVGAEAYLVVVPVDTAFGRLVLGAVLPKPLDAATVEVVADALKRAAQPGRK